MCAQTLYSQPLIHELKDLLIWTIQNKFPLNQGDIHDYLRTVATYT
jgi:hypothetical protein